MVDSPALAGVHRTAIGAATLRASHLFREGEPKILRDEFALPLSGVSQQEAEARLAQFPGHTSAGWVLRGRYAEDRLAAVRAPNMSSLALASTRMRSVMLLI